TRRSSDLTVGSGYLPNSRVNVNAIIQLYRLADTNVFGDITIENNIFDGIQSDIISIDRTAAGREINIRFNQFLNYQLSAVRFDGGYNNGTLNIEENLFRNDVKGGQNAILFRAYSASSGNLQIINILNNVFENIGNVTNNPTDSYPQSAVIATSTYNSLNIDFNIVGNEFINTHNSIHLRKNENTTKAVWDVDVLENSFINPTGYIYREDGNIALVQDNSILDENHNLLDESRINITLTASSHIIRILDVTAEYVVITYTFNSETNTYDIVEQVLTGVVGSTVKITPQPKLGFYTEKEEYEGVIKADGSLVIEIVYEEFTATFTYNLVLNGGNMFYANREAMVLDWLADYNLFGGTSYTLTTIPTDT